MRNEDHVVVRFLGEYDLEDNTATVNVKNFPDLRTVGFNDVFKFQPHSKVLALGRDVSGKLIATGGILNDILYAKISLCLPLVKSLRYICILKWVF